MTLGEVFAFFDFGAYFMMPLRLLYGPKVLVTLDVDVNWQDFACLAFYDRLRHTTTLSGEETKIACEYAFGLIREMCCTLDETNDGMHESDTVFIQDNRWVMSINRHSVNLMTGAVVESGKPTGGMEVSIAFFLRPLITGARDRFLKEKRAHDGAKQTKQRDACGTP